MPTPTPAFDCPYYAVVFVSTFAAADSTYADTATELLQRVRTIPGFLGVDSARGHDGLGITVSYFATTEAIDQWRNDPIHQAGRTAGRDRWYDQFTVHITQVQRSYDFTRTHTH